MKREWRLWHWPYPLMLGQQRELYPTAEAAMLAAGKDREYSRSDWESSANGGFHIPLPDGDHTGRYQSYAVVPEQVPESDSDRIELAVEMLLENGQTDGDHHKAWVIDQTLRLLLGDEYDDAIRGYMDGEDGPETYSWDEGIAP